MFQWQFWWVLQEVKGTQSIHFLKCGIYPPVMQSVGLKLLQITELKKVTRIHYKRRFEELGKGFLKFN